MWTSNLAPAMTDEELSRSVAAAIRQQGFVRLGNIRCQARDGTIVLDGRVANLALKHLAGQIAARVPGVEKVENRLRTVDRVTPS